MTAALVLFTWDGEAMQPGSRFAKVCDEKFTVGEVYRMEVNEARSGQSHRHYFASIQEMWENLPEDQCDRFPSPEHLRKYALCRAGYCTSHSIVLAEEADAKDTARAIREAAPFSVLTVKGNVVQIFAPASQSLKAMGKEEFQKSKDAVFDVLAKMIGVKQQSTGQMAEEYRR